MCGMARVSAQKPPRNSQEAKEGAGCAARWKMTSEKEPNLKSCRGCTCNRRLGFQHVLFYVCLCAQTCFVCVGLHMCVCEHLCGGERTT